MLKCSYFFGYEVPYLKCYLRKCIYNGCGWIHRDKSGRTQLMGLRNQSRRESTLHTKLEALTWAMKNMLNHLICQLFGTNCKDVIVVGDPQAWPKFST